MQPPILSLDRFLAQFLTWSKKRRSWAGKYQRGKS